MNLRNQLIKLQYQVDHLALRERASMLGAAILVILVIWFFIFYKAQKASLATIQTSVTSAELQINAFRQKKITIEQLAQDNTVAKLMDKFQRLRMEMKDLERKMAKYEQRFISEQEIAKVLYAMLKVSQGVTIVKFSDASYDVNEAVEDINEQRVMQETSTLTTVAKTALKKDTGLATLPTPELTTAGAPVNRTEYVLVLKGDYFSILNYLTRLERLDWQLYWDKLEYKVEQYPEGIATIWFYTLKPGSVLPTPIVKNGASK